MGHAGIDTTMGYVHHVPRHDDADWLTRFVAESVGVTTRANGPIASAA